jgi:uncharacterized membrane protein
MSRRSVFIGALGLAVAGLAIVGHTGFEERVGVATSPNAGWLTIPADEMSPDTARIFSFKDAAGKKLRFLLARDSRGRLYTVFDACEQCFKFHKGYTVSGHYLICGYCGNRYRLSEIAKGEASCVPVTLAHSETGKTVKVSVRDLERGRNLF